MPSVRLGDPVSQPNPVIQFLRGPSACERRIWWGDRHPLVYQDALPSGNILTIENYCKWYTIYLVAPEGVVYAPPIANALCETLVRPTGITAWNDHVPNPHFCRLLEAALDAEWCEESFEMIVGRYATEIQGYDFFPK